MFPKLLEKQRVGGMVSAMSSDVSAPITTNRLRRAFAFATYMLSSLTAMALLLADLLLDVKLFQGLAVW